MNAESWEYEHLIGKCRDAARCGLDAWRVQSTGEQVAVALVLNRPDWLEMKNYTIAEAIGRAGAAWVSIMRDVEQELVDEGLLPMQRG